MRPQNLESQSWKVRLNLSKQAACHSLWGLNYVTNSRPFPPLPLPKSGLLLPGLQSSQQVTTARKLQPSCLPVMYPSSGKAQPWAWLNSSHITSDPIAGRISHSGTTRRVHPQRPQVGSLNLVWLKAIQSPGDSLISDFQQRYSLETDP